MAANVCSQLCLIVCSWLRESVVFKRSSTALTLAMIAFRPHHCELNWIERYWGAAKKYARRHCGYSLPALRMCVAIALSQTLDELPAELRADLISICLFPRCSSSGALLVCPGDMQQSIGRERVAL